MKRSEINAHIEEAIHYLEKNNFYLPKYACWPVSEWQYKDKGIQEIIERQLGWDVSDYGRGDFTKIGLIHFTIRNGIPNSERAYCEKIMLMQEGQMGLMHFHFKKMEDIICRGGGILMLQLYNSTDDKKLSDSNVEVSVDGTKRVLEAGAIIELDKGESITLPPKRYHKFWVKPGTGKVMIGEVSTVNDDVGDNHYLDTGIRRFPDLEEDQNPHYLLCSDYNNYIKI